MNARNLLFHLRRRLHLRASLGMGKGGCAMRPSSADFLKKDFKTRTNTNGRELDEIVDCRWSMVGAPEVMPSEWRRLAILQFPRQIER
jgi:hypothetical protein